jgi:hypothetical protein
MRCIKELAMAEPLVDTVEPNQVRKQAIHIRHLVLATGGRMRMMRMIISSRHDDGVHCMQQQQQH